MSGSMKSAPGLVGSVANYENMHQVGEGTYGFVYRARDSRDGSTVALKRLIIHKDYTGFPLCAVREIKFLKQLNHPNIVELLDIVSSKGCEHLDGPSKVGDKAQQAIKVAEKLKADQAAIRESNLSARGDKDSSIEEEREREKQRQYVLAEQEKADNLVSSLLLQRCGSLYLVFQYLEHDLGGLVDAKYKFKPKEIKCIMKQLFTVLDFLQEKKILHRDIKCSNVLISDRHQVKLADFGLARSTLSPDGREGKVKLTNNVVTMWYKAPELLLGSNRYNYAVDMWSTGCILAELELGRPIMPGRTEAEQMDLICRVIGTPSEASWPEVTKMPFFDQMLRHAASTYSSSLKSVVGTAGTNLSEAAMSLLDRVLVADPNMRASAKVALNSKYFILPPQAPHSPTELEPLNLAPGVSMHEYETKMRRKEKEKSGGESSVAAAPLQPQNPYGGPPTSGYPQVHVQVPMPGQGHVAPQYPPQMGGYVASGAQAGHSGRGQGIYGPSGAYGNPPPPPPPAGSASYGGAAPQPPHSSQGAGGAHWRGNNNKQKQQKQQKHSNGGQKRGRGGY